MWEQRGSDSPAVRTVWRAHVEEAGRYPIEASEYWGISFARHADSAVSAVLDGPSLTAASTHSVVGESYWGVELGAHVFVPTLGKGALAAGTLDLPVTDGRCRLGAYDVAVPAFEELEGFVDRLVASGVLVCDADVERALGGEDAGYSARSWQRRFRSVTGLTRKQIEQLERARTAYRLLQDGLSCAEAALAAGYADQAHLTRSMRAMRGQTPARILAGEPPPV